MEVGWGWSASSAANLALCPFSWQMSPKRREESQDRTSANRPVRESYGHPMSESHPIEAEQFVEVYRAANHGELIAVRMGLDALGARYYVKNEFGSLGSLSAVGSDTLSVMVEAWRAPQCWEAIQAALR
jgi:hypothetical protein